jgi:hypothetical protein
LTAWDFLRRRNGQLLPFEKVATEMDWRLSK